MYFSDADADKPWHKLFWRVITARPSPALSKQGEDTGNNNWAEKASAGLIELINTMLIWLPVTYMKHGPRQDLLSYVQKFYEVIGWRLNVLSQNKDTSDLPQSYSEAVETLPGIAKLDEHEKNQMLFFLKWYFKCNKKEKVEDRPVKLQGSHTVNYFEASIINLADVFDASAEYVLGELSSIMNDIDPNNFADSMFRAACEAFAGKHKNDIPSKFIYTFVKMSYAWAALSFSASCYSFFTNEASNAKKAPAIAGSFLAVSAYYRIKVYFNKAGKVKGMYTLPKPFQKGVLILNVAGVAISFMDEDYAAATIAMLGIGAGAILSFWPGLVVGIGCSFISSAFVTDKYEKWFMDNIWGENYKKNNGEVIKFAQNALGTLKNEYPLFSYQEEMTRNTHSSKEHPELPKNIVDEANIRYKELLKEIEQDIFVYESTTNIYIAYVVNSYLMDKSYLDYEITPYKSKCDDFSYCHYDKSKAEDLLQKNIVSPMALHILPETGQLVYDMIISRAGLKDSFDDINIKCNFTYDDDLELKEIRESISLYSSSMRNTAKFILEEGILLKRYKNLCEQNKLEAGDMPVPQDVVI